jgi:predicted PurR-regulated permease PerM
MPPDLRMNPNSPRQSPEHTAAEAYAGTLTARIVLAASIAGLLVLGYQVLHLFVIPTAWAVILVYLSWPVYRRLSRMLGWRATLSASIMTVLLAAVFALPVLWVAVMLGEEVPVAFHAVLDFLARGPSALPESIANIPWLGPELRNLMTLWTDDRAALASQVLGWVKPLVDQSVYALGGIGRMALKFGFALLAAFFFYRDGEMLVIQAQRALHNLFGWRTNAYLKAVADTTRAVLYGLVLTAVIQGLLAGLGYWVAGVKAPALLGVLTTVLALVPFGTPLVWGAVGVVLLAAGDIVAGIGVLAWGALVVSQIDNLFRPLLISSATRIPYLLVLVGVLGGIGAFGLLGLFLGPIVIAVLLAVWREWLLEEVPPASAPQTGDNADSQPPPGPPK